MKPLRLILAGVILVAAVAAPSLIHSRAESSLYLIDHKLRQQAGLLAQLSVENERLSDLVAKVKSSQSLSESEVIELLKLRNEARQLRCTLKGMEQLRSEMQRMRDGLNDLAEVKGRGGAGNATLLTDALEQELRAGRVARLKEWLKEAPEEEETPELQFVPEDWWVRSADWSRVSDDEYQGWISAGRAVGELKFATMAFQALKAFVTANGGRFPTVVSQLKPYFVNPIEDVILKRYDIVPTSSLTKVLAEVGGDWVITQKAPVNKRFDARVAIGLTDIRSGGGEGRWDPVQ